MPVVPAAAKPSPASSSVSSGEEWAGPPDSYPFMPPPVTCTFADFISSTGFTVEAPDPEPYVHMNMLSAVDQPESGNGYATDDADDEGVAPTQPPTRLGCGVSGPGFGRSFLTYSLVCALLFVVCATAAPLTTSGVGGASEHVCTAPTVGGARWAAPAATMPAALPPDGSPDEWDPSDKLSPDAIPPRRHGRHRWENFPDPKHDTWEPIENLAGHETTISDFRKRAREELEQHEATAAEKRKEKTKAREAREDFSDDLNDFEMKRESVNSRSGIEGAETSEHGATGEAAFASRQSLAHRGLMQNGDDCEEDAVLVEFKTFTGYHSSEHSWSMPEATSSRCNWGQKYGEEIVNEHVYSTTCCFQANITALPIECEDQGDDGWEGTYVQVPSNGKSYCGAFLSGSYFEELVDIVPAPPPPPSPPPIPNAPPIEISKDTVNITESLHSFQQLRGVLQAKEAQHVVLFVDVVLAENEALPDVNFSLSIQGACSFREGNKCALDGIRAYRLFTVSQDVKLELRNLILENGGPLESNGVALDGGALHLSGSARAVLEDCIIRTSSAASGGALYCSQASLSMRRTTVVDNTAFIGGAVHSFACRISLTNSSVESNVATSQPGGGLYLEFRSNTDVINSSISNNTSAWNGGGVYLFESVLNVDSLSHLANNTAGISGGAIYAVHQASIVFNRSTLSHNSASEYGGGIYVTDNVSLTLVDSEVHHNGALLSDGGGINIFGTNSVQLVDSFFSENTAGDDGGSIAAYGTGSLLMEQTVVEASEAGDLGGAIRIASGGVLIGSDLKIRHNYAVGQGGGLHLSDGELHNVILSYNQAGINGGALALVEHAFLQDMQFKANWSPSGGALAILVGASVEMNSSRLVANTADQDGGAVYISESSTLLMHGSGFMNHFAEFGGAISCIQSTIEVWDSGFQYNVARDSGGAMNLQSCRVAVERDSRFAHNSAAGGNGGGFCLRDASELNVTGLRAEKNSAAVFGGAIRLQTGSLLRASQSVFDWNSCQYEGGSISSDTSTVAIDNSSLLFSSTNSVGGTIALTASRMAVERSRVAHSFSNMGGALACQGGGVLTLRSAQLENNTALQGGGGVQVDTSCIVEIHETTFRMNKVLSSGGLGGGMLLGRAVVCHVTESTFHGNFAMEGDGGGIWLSFLIQRVLVVDTAFEAGGAAQGTGIYVSHVSGAVDFEGLRFSRNAAVVGPNIFWVINSGFERIGNITEITCVECTFPADTALLSTSAVSYVVLEVETGKPVTECTLDSGTSLPSMEYEALDFYGNRTITADDLVVVIVSSDATLSGPTIVPMDTVNRTTRFDNLTVSGEPGVSYNVIFAPSIQSWEAVIVTVHMAPCAVGDVYDSISHTCNRCAEGFIKFDSLATECTSCKDSGMTCHGGSDFTLDDGYWMAYDSIGAACNVSDTQCFIDRVYLCDVEAACTTEYERTNVPGSHLPATAVCASGYNNDTVLCGSCERGYSANAAKECVQCPHDITAYVTSILWTLVIFAMIYVGVRYAMSIMSTRQSNRVATTFEDGEDIPELAGATFGIWCGWMQVAGQTLDIYDTEVVPNMYRYFLVVPGALDLNIFKMMNTTCIMNWALGDGNAGVLAFVDGFRLNFMFHAALPCLIMGPNISRGVQAVLHYTRELGQRFTRTVSRKEAPRMNMVRQLATKKNEEVETRVSYLSLSIFLLKLIHPQVSTFVFYIFACSAIHFQSEHATFWNDFDRTLQCYSPEWMWYAVVGKVMIVIFVIGFPLFLFLSIDRLYKQKKVEELGIDVYHWARNLKHEDGVWYSRTLSRDALQPRIEGDGVTPGDDWIIVHPYFVSEDCDTSCLANILNKLEEDNVDHSFKIICKPFRRKFYWWSIYEIFQRLLHSSVVILVRMIDKKYDTFYGLFISYTSMLIQAYVSPYILSPDNQLQTCIMFNFTVLNTYFIAEEYVFEEGATESSVMGVTMLTVQLLMLLWIMKLLIMEHGPLMFKKVNRAATFTRRRLTSINSAFDLRNFKARTGPRGSLDEDGIECHTPSSDQPILDLQDSISPQHLMSDPSKVDWTFNTAYDDDDEEDAIELMKN
ncbi:hypothetical protein CYMTET_13491 [Cymbomonas tetramitiformis]|uniref:Chromo domain-containing protein n=1 Tax=Cymbomonas tetramitiformis TaxID=36881 RepID=A0AAE0GI15_9CHLO|nr:hypothetical protein CYMTET_13491 [Cymbomonas tetramitiformis]